MATSIFNAVTTAPAATAGIPTGERETYLRTTGVSGSVASLPDQSTLRLTGDIEIIVRLSVDNWATGSNQRLVCKRSGGGAGAYEMWLSGTGALSWTQTAFSTASSSVTLPSVGFVNGARYWLRVTRRSSDGRVQFFWSSDMETEPLVWAQLGVDRTVTAGALTTTADPVYIGGIGSFSDFCAAKFVQVIIRKVITGVDNYLDTALHADFGAATAGATTYTDRTGKAVTLSSGASFTQADAGWRFAVQALVPSHGARVGYAKVGSTGTAARVSSYEWYDLTADVAGIEWTRGAPPSGQGYPRANVGVGNMMINNESRFYSPWNTAASYTGGTIANPSISRSWATGTLVRVVYFKATAATGVSTASNGFTTITRVDWSPRFTGFVESWDEVQEIGRDMVKVTLVETTSLLARVQLQAGSPVGAGETLIARLVRLLAAGMTWPFPIIDGGTWPGYNDSASLTLQATAISMNRLQEVYLSGASAADTQISSAMDGSLKVGLGQGPDFQCAPPVFTLPVVRFSTSTDRLASDADYFPRYIDAQVAQPVTLTNNADTVINDITAQRSGGTEVNYTTNESIGLYGRRTFSRTDLICTNDTMVTLYTSFVLQLHDGWKGTAWNGYVDQTLQPSKLRFANQGVAQRAVVLGNNCVVDWYAAPTNTEPDVRLIGRITQTHDVVQPLKDAVMWTTDLSVLSNYAYLPTF